MKALSWPPSARVLTVAAGVVPATLLVALGWVLVFVALFLGRERRAYAERVYGRVVELAAVLTAGPRTEQPRL